MYAALGSLGWGTQDNSSSSIYQVDHNRPGSPALKNITSAHMTDQGCLSPSTNAPIIYLSELHVYSYYGDTWVSRKSVASSYLEPGCLAKGGAAVQVGGIKWCGVRRTPVANRKDAKPDEFGDNRPMERVLRFFH